MRIKKDSALDPKILQYSTQKYLDSSIRNKLELKEINKWNGGQVTYLHESNQVSVRPFAFNASKIYRSKQSPYFFCTEFFQILVNKYKDSKWETRNDNWQY